MDVIQYYKLKEYPYSVSPNPRFLFLDPVRLALEKIKVSVNSREGLVLLTADIGGGKTSLLNYLFNHFIEQDIKMGIIKSSYRTEMQLLRMINDSLGNRKTHNKFMEMKEVLKRYLVEHKEGNCTLFVDEGDSLTKKQCDLLKDLLNVESHDTKFLQIVISASPDFKKKLKTHWYKALNSRVALFASIPPLKKNEVEALLKFRWMVAKGSDKKFPFSKKAIREIYKLTQGNQRSVVWLAKWTLFRTSTFLLKEITPEVIKKAYQDWKDEEVAYEQK